MKSLQRGKTNLSSGQVQIAELSIKRECTQKALGIPGISQKSICRSFPAVHKSADMDIIITMLNGRYVTLTVNPGDTVGSLKRIMRSHLDVAPECQKLTINNGQVKILTDSSKPLSYYGLKPGSRVSLLVVEPTTIQVFLKNEKGQTTTYDIEPDETVQNFKSKVYAREKVPVDQQRLIYEGKEMMNGRLTDYGVEALGTIYLTLRLRGG